MPQAVTGRSLARKIRVRTQISVSKYFGSPCVTSRKVACSIPDAVVGIFHGLNASGRTMVLGSTQPLTEMSTKDVSRGVKAALQISYFECIENSGSIYVLWP